MTNLRGGVVIWVFAAVELLTFGLFFFALAWTMRSEPEVFSSASALVHPRLAALNTAVLLTASWAAARGVGASWRWWGGVAGLGGVFLVVKGVEYAHVLGHGVSLSTNDFWFFYLFLTGFHAVHVVAGVVLAFLVARAHRSGQDWRGEPEEAVAMYWHVVDLIWLGLFPLLYLIPQGVRP